MKTILKWVLAGGMVAGGLAGAPGRADVITNLVRTSQELQTALTVAASNGSDDLIYLEAGIYRGGFNFDTMESQSLTLQPKPGLKSGEVVLDGERLGRVLRLNAGNATHHISLLSLVIRNGSIPQDQYGSGVYLWTQGDVVINDSLIVSNANFLGGGYLGGGIYVGSARNVLLTNNTVRANTAYGGAGVEIRGAVDVFLVGNLISGNTSGDSAVETGPSVSGRVVARQNKLIGNNNGSGGLFRAGSSVLIEGNEIAQNSGFQGITASAPDVTVRLNVFRANAVSSALSFGSLFTNLLVSRNEFIQTSGRGVQLTVTGITPQIPFNYNGVATFEDNLFRGNNGGGIYATLQNGAATLRFVNNTLFDNSITGNGGGASFNISGNTEVLQVYNNILRGNRATGLGQDVFVSGNGSDKKFSFNNYHDLSGLWNIATNNIDVDPLFVDAPNGDFHLRANSLCLNAGFNDAPGLPLVDKDGNVRTGDGVVDMGAYEQSVSDQHPADANLNWVLNAEEFDAYARAWTNRAPWATGPNPIPIDYVTRAGFLLERGGAYTNGGGGKPRNWKPGP